MKKNEPVKNIMSTDLITVARNGTFSEVHKLLHEFNVRHILVEEAGKLVGIISLVDVLRYSFSKEYISTDEYTDAALDQVVSIEKLMSDKPLSLNHKATVKDAISTLSDHDFNSIPIVDDESMLVGIVTTKDILNYMLEQY